MTEEGVKGSVHGVMAAFLGGPAAYNLMRWCVLRDAKHAINTVLYIALIAHELRQAKHHWSKPAC